MQDMQDMIDRLNQSGKRLSKGHRKIAQYIVEHYEKAVFMTASRLGESVGVSESTVVRFASAMGYEGYPQLQRSLQELVSHRLTANQRFEMSTEIDPSAALGIVLKSDMQNLRATLEQMDNGVFDEVVKRLLSARAIYVMGLRSAAPLAQFMGYYLNYIFDDVHLVSSGATDVFEEISKLREDDVLIGISFPRYSTRTLEAMRFAKRCGAQVVAITDGPMSPLTDIADLALTARTDMASFVDSLAAPLSVINALLVALGLHRKEALTQHFRKLESIWETYEVYLEEAGAQQKEADDTHA
ncbi:MAG: MurR/RpiR family transcriptional regulator [Clostridia bacterium]|nr:MurR/RpiR family transcriptional regulator [Clostridia bacterium]